MHRQTSISLSPAFVEGNTLPGIENGTRSYIDARAVAMPILRVVEDEDVIIFDYEVNRPYNSVGKHKVNVTVYDGTLTDDGALNERHVINEHRDRQNIGRNLTRLLLCVSMLEPDSEGIRISSIVSLDGTSGATKRRKFLFFDIRKISEIFGNVVAEDTTELRDYKFLRARPFTVAQTRTRDTMFHGLQY